MKADLHVHTTASDGTATSEEIMKEAQRIGLAAVGITDHDNMDEIIPAGRKAGRYQVEIVPGIEFSTEWQDKEIHILGYYLDFSEKWFQEKLQKLQTARFTRAESIVAKLNILGFTISFKRVLALAGNGSIGRPHIAQALIEKGYVRSVEEAFTRLIGRGALAYVPRVKVTPEEAVGIILNAGGVPVIAHVGVPPADDLIKTLVLRGLKGLEVYYPEHDQMTVNHYLKIAARYHLIVTGGSDFHGFNQDRASLGTCQVDYGVVQELKRLRIKKEG